LVQQGVKLFTIRGHSKRPLLATSVRLTPAQASASKSLSLTVSKLRRGTAGKRGEVRAVPLFFGINSVTLRKKFDLQGVADSVRAQLPALYAKNMRG